MLSDAETEDDLAKAMAYAAKVDEFNRTGMVTLSTLEYEGPDLSPGAKRDNSMRGVKRSIGQTMYDEDGHRIPGVKTAVLYPSQDQAASRG